MTFPTRCMMTLFLLAAACGDAPLRREYRLAGNLVPGAADCNECSFALVLDAVPVDDPLGPHHRFYLGVGREIDFRFRWGVEQIVEIETWKEAVPAGLMDASGVHHRMVRVLEANPLPPDTHFQMRFDTWPPGTFSLTVTPEGEGGEALLLSDYATSVRIECEDPTPCRDLAEAPLGERAFTLDLLHATSEGGPLRLQAVRFDP